MEFKHHLNIEKEAREKSRQLEAEDNQIEEQKRLYLEKSRNDPLLFLREEVQRQEEKLVSLKKELYEREAELKRQPSLKPSSSKEIQFLGRG
jgi:hypothetical protein